MKKRMRKSTKRALVMAMMIALFFAMTAIASTETAEHGVAFEKGKNQASLFQISDQPKTAQVKYSGSFPQITGITDAAFAAKMDGLLKEIFDAAVKKAKAEHSKDLTFSYDTIAYQNFTSLIIHTSISSGNTASDDVHTLLLDNSAYKLYSFTDLLGPNAYRLAADEIQRQIAAAPEGTYFTNENKFTGIASEPHFYIDSEGKLCVIFDKYSIAPGATGTPVFVVTPA